MLGSTLNQRFRLEQLLGKGAEGPLYLATDQTNGELLSVQFLSRPVNLHSEPGLRYRRLMARLKGVHHPHLLVPVETAVSGGLVFQAAPYYPSLPLEEALAAQPFTLEESAAVLRQLAGALDVLHGAGVVHGAVGPATVLVSRDDGLQAVLAGPALALLTGPERLGADPAAAAYASPEDSPWAEEEPDARSDLYSLGMLAYRLLTGALPFDAGGAAQWFRHHLVTAAPNPRALRAELPPRLAAIVLKLLEKSRARRYQSAAGLLADLEGWDAEGAPGRGGEPIGERDRRRAFAHAPPPVGRESGREALAAALGRASTGRGSLLVFAGASGVGKHGLFRAGYPHVEAAGGLLLRCRVPPGEWCPPFHLPRAWLEDLLLHWELLPDLRRRDLLYRLNGALDGNGGLPALLAPGLRPLLPQGDPSPPLPGGRERARMLHVLADALTALADPRHPLVLWVDDLAQADGDSIALLRHLTQRLGESALVLATTMNPERGAPAGEPARWLKEPATRRALTWVDLAPLDGEQTRHWTAALLGIPWDAPPPPAADLVATVADHLTRHCGGNPWAHELTLRLLIHRRALLPNETHARYGMPWRLDPAALAAWSPPTTLSDLIRAWLATLPEGLMLVLEAASVFPGAIAFDLLAQVLEGFPEEVLQDRIEAAVSLGALYRARDGLRFARPRLRLSVYGALAPVRRRHYHQALGAALEAREEPAAARCHEAALHFREGGDAERFRTQLRLALAAAAQAQAGHGVVRAGRLLQGAAAEAPEGAALLGPTGPPPEEFALETAAALAGLGDFAQAGAALAAALAGTGDPARRVDLLLEQAGLEARQGRLDEAGAALEEALALQGESLASNAMGTALARLADGAARRYGNLMAGAGGDVPSLPDAGEERLCRTLEACAEVFARSRRERAALSDERLVRIAGRRYPSPILVRALIRLGEALEQPDGEPLVQAQAILRTHAFPWEQARLHLALGRCALARFDLGAAREALETARVRFRALADPLGMSEAEQGLFELARLQGPVPALARSARELLRLADLIREPDATDWARGALAYAAAVAGRLACARAAAVLLSAADGLAQRGRADDARYLLLLCLDMALGCGQPAEAQGCLRRAEALGDPGAASVSGRLRAALGEWHFAQAAGLAEAEGVHGRQARAAVKALRAGLRDTPALLAGLATLQVMERGAQGRAEALRGALAEGAPLLEAQGARLPLARMHLRAAEALRALGERDWAAVGGKALLLLDGLGAGGFARHARDVLGLVESGEDAAAEIGAAEDGAAEDGAAEDGAPEGTGAVAGTARAAADVQGAEAGTEAAMGGAGAGGGPRGAELRGGVLALLEQIGSRGHQAPQALHAPLLRLFLEEAEAEVGALFLPDADGLPALAAQLPEETLGVEWFNRWLVETVWREGKGQVLDQHARPGADPRAGTARTEAQSVLCLPLAAGGGRAVGVVALSSSRGRRIYDRADLARLGGLARQAGGVLAVNRALERDSALRRAEHEDAEQRQYLLDWARNAAAGETAGDMLQSYLDAAGTPQGFDTALLLQPSGGAPGAGWGEASTLAPEEARGRGPFPNGWRGLTLPPAGSPEGAASLAATALRLLEPLPLTGGDGPQPSAAEQALLNAWSARDAVWLPVVRRGAAVALVLLLARERRGLSPGRLASHLYRPLQLLAPALAQALEAQARAVEAVALRRERDGWERQSNALRRYLPPLLLETQGTAQPQSTAQPEGAAPPEPRGTEGAERDVALVTGRIAGAHWLARLGATEWTRALGAYYERLDHALRLHDGALDRAGEGAWLAHFRRGPESALHGARTIHELLDGLMRERMDNGLPPLRTGLGVHLGPVIVGTVAAGERLEPLLGGEAPRVAARLAELGSGFRCGILLSGELAGALGSAQGFAPRPLGPMRVGAGERRIDVSELYECRDADVAGRMGALAQHWQQALRHYLLGHWPQAEEGLRTYAERVPEDRIARWFLRRCRQRRAAGGG